MPVRGAERGAYRSRRGGFLSGCAVQPLAATAIDRCAAQGWFQGKTADTFGVGQPMTRAVRRGTQPFFWLASGETYYRIFSDVPQGAWYEPALRACYEHGAVTRQTGDFRPAIPSPGRNWQSC